jgi:hypothetical protein
MTSDEKASYEARLTLHKEIIIELREALLRVSEFSDYEPSAALVAAKAIAFCDRKITNEIMKRENQTAHVRVIKALTPK